MKILINGGCGFLGSNLSSYGIQNNHEIVVFDNLSREGAYSNKQWLESVGDFSFVHGDIRCRDDIETVVRKGGFDAIFHLSGQVTMTKSISNPYRDFEINTLGALNLLEAVRKYSPDTAVFFSSTNKVYGDLESLTYEEQEKRYICKEFPRGFNESLPLDFRSPYGCSKGAADQYMLDFARIYGIKATVFRHSSMYGSRQYATIDQGWIGWFVQKAIEKYLRKDVEPFTISGNGKQVRDLLHAEDMINLYYSALVNVDKVSGQAFNIGGTMENSLSILELLDMLEEVLAVKLDYYNIPTRQSDQKIFVADITKINKSISWSPKVGAREGVLNMIEWVKGNIQC